MDNNCDFVINVDEEKELRLSNQAIGSLMLALQKCLMEQSDITQILKEWKLKDSAEGLVVLNPSVIKIEESE